MVAKLLATLALFAALFAQEQFSWASLGEELRRVELARFLPWLGLAVLLVVVGWMAWKAIRKQPAPGPPVVPELPASVPDQLLDDLLKLDMAGIRERVAQLDPKAMENGETIRQLASS